MNTGQRKYWKTYAKAHLRGKWGIAIAGMLAVQGINLLGNFMAVLLFPGDSTITLVLSEIFSFIVSLIGLIFSTGYCYMQLNIYRGREYRLGDILHMFHEQSDHVLTAGLVVALLNTVAQIPLYYVIYMVDQGTTVESLMRWYKIFLVAAVLWLVLSVVLTVPFTLVFCLLADYPEMKGMEALKTSARMMKGHMGQYLILELSFLPLMFLSMISMYIGFLWLIPYMDFTETAFYLYVTGELEEQRLEQERAAREEIEQRLVSAQEDTERDFDQADVNSNDYNSEA
ncbi:DUF975 family protein [Blautia sp. MSJ-19]|uniref:DUF975 family protein n=1 Tax=Blautia sp. MSJ-19 TaxID=2841517 RepID=UPI001C0EA1E9|nr:DUF975 family protein [Blautia sp. MSJ-19]MBU5480785.1 DUF975 family protein [Blautia sp. MSJ-19]